MSMKLEIPVEPKPQKRARHSYHGNRPRTYEDKDMRAWRTKVTEYVKEHWDYHVLEGAIVIDMTFYCKAPKAIATRPTPRARAVTWERYNKYLNEEIYVETKPDLDNLEKAVYDSISKAGNVWKDDNQIVEHRTRKVYSPNPRIELTIQEVSKEL